MQAPCSRRFRREGSCLLKPFSKPSDLSFSPTLSAQSTGHKEQLRALPRISNALDLPAKASAARPRRAFEITRSIAQITASSNQRCRTAETSKEMAGTQSPSILVILCLILAALMGSARGQDGVSPVPADSPILSPNMGPALAPDAMAPMADATAPAPDTMAPMADATAPAPDAMAPAPDAMTAMSDTPAPAPMADAAAAPAPLAITSVAATAARRDGPPPNCVQEAFGLAGNNAPCQSLVTSFRSSIGSNPSMDDGSVDAAVAKAGTISSSCCYAVRQFIQDGCSCDNQLLNLLPMVGAQASQIQFVAKASQRSSCASSQYGGYFSNPCDGSSSGGAAGRKLFMQAPVVV